jgi:pimeloyl-ACP methyl ester carboxylesterase
MRRTRGFIDLAFNLVEEVTDLVEHTHGEVVERSTRRFAPSEPAKRAATAVTSIQTFISGGVFDSIRAINGITRFSVNAAAEIAGGGVERPFPLDPPGPTMPLGETAEGNGSRLVDHLQSSLNGFWGDYLSRSNQRLDLGMMVRHQGRDLPITPKALESAFPNPTRKVCVFVHGLAATEWLWSLSSEEQHGSPEVTFGTRLHDDLGITPIYLRYNTGRHISENGRALATLLTEVLEAYPVPVEEISLVGHSMGGLVVRSAAHFAREHDEPWVAHLRHVACLGSPHLGAPLEKAVNLLTGVLRNVDTAGTQVLAELLGCRSAGVKDLRYGYTVDEEWVGIDPDEVFADARRNVPLVDGVGYYFLAATVSREPGHLLGQLVGDLMVRLSSASGQARDPARSVHFSSGVVFPGMNHLRIANQPDVYEVLRDLLTA